MLSSFGMGSGSDITTAVSSTRDYKFSQLSDEGFDQVEALREKPIVQDIKTKKFKLRSRKSDGGNTFTRQVYEGKVLSPKPRDSRLLSSARRHAKASKGILIQSSASHLVLLVV